MVYQLDPHHKLYEEERPAPEYDRRADRRVYARGAADDGY